MSWGILVGFIIYLIILAFIGWWSNKYTKNEAQYFIGGRHVHILAASLSDKASDFSGWLMLGYPGSAFKAGVGAIWAAIGCLGGTLLNWTMMAVRLRIYAGKLKAITIPDFLEARVKDHTKLIRFISGLIILVFMTAYVAAQFAAGGKTFAEAFNVTYAWGAAITFIILVAYVVVGGFFAVVWTDVFQALLMLTVLVVVPFLIVGEVGGFANAINLIGQADPTKLSPFGGAVGLAAVVFAIGYASWIVGYIGQPHIQTRFMAAKHPKQLRRPGIFISIIWTILVLWGAFFGGFLGIALVQKGSLTVSDPEQIIPALIVHFTPPLVAGILISGIISAVMSTADSQLLVAASAVGRDYIHKIFNYEPSQKQMVNIGRLVVFILGLLALWFALRPNPLVYGMVATAWGGLGVGFGPPLILSLWWKRITKEGIIIGMLYGLISEVYMESTIGWAFTSGPLKGVPIFFVNFFITLFVIIIVSLVTKPPEDVVKRHLSLYKKVPIESGTAKTVAETRAKSQVEHVAQHVLYNALIP